MYMYVFILIKEEDIHPSIERVVYSVYYFGSVLDHITGVCAHRLDWLKRTTNMDVYI